MSDTLNEAFKELFTKIKNLSSENSRTFPDQEKEKNEHHTKNQREVSFYQELITFKGKFQDAKKNVKSLVNNEETNEGLENERKINVDLERMKTTMKIAFEDFEDTLKEVCLEMETILNNSEEKLLKPSSENDVIANCNAAQPGPSNTTFPSTSRNLAGNTNLAKGGTSKAPLFTSNMNPNSAKNEGSPQNKILMHNGPKYLTLLKDDKPYKIVLFYVAETANDRKKVIAILQCLTKLSLRNIDIQRIGVLSNAKIRPIVVSFDSKAHLNDVLKNRYSLKDTPFKGTKIVKYRNISTNASQK